MNLRLWNIGSSSQARSIVRSVLSNSGPTNVQNLYKLVVEHELAHPIESAAVNRITSSSSYNASSGPLPPHPSHIIRSMAYLKQHVLPDLARTNDIEKVHVRRTLSPEELEERKKSMTKASRKALPEHSLSQVDVYLWQLRTNPPTLPKPQPDKKVFGAEVGVGEDWSHLNKRRRRARPEKVMRDVSWMRTLQRATAAGESTKSL